MKPKLKTVLDLPLVGQPTIYIRDIKITSIKQLKRELKKLEVEDGKEREKRKYER